MYIVIAVAVEYIADAVAVHVKRWIELRRENVC